MRRRDSVTVARMQPIEFYNRYTGERETEEIYGERWLRLAYETAAGRLGVETFAKRVWFSKWFGWRMRQPSSRTRIAPFVRDFGVDVSEFADPIEHYESFNAFFYRALDPAARPIDADPDSVVFPADGRHLGFSQASAIEGVFVKGQRFDLTTLLGDPELARRYEDGTLVLSRLCPVDYHRYHFCAAGTPDEPQLINGHLYSVSPVALRRNLSLLGENKRMLTTLRTERVGEILVMEIGATNVGTIRQRFSPRKHVEKGDEKGWFEFGGSAVLTLFEPGRIELAEDLQRHSAEQRETYARMGDVLGSIA